MNLKKQSSSFINFFLVPLLVISLVGSISLLPGLIQKLPDKIFLVLVCLLIVGYLFYHYPVLDCKKFFHYIKIPLLVTIILITIIWQIMLIRSLSGNYGWDPHFMLYDSLKIPYADDISRSYFSLYPNNFLLLIIEKVFQACFGLKSLASLTYGLNIFNLVIIDISGIVLFFAVKNLFGALSAYCSIFLYWSLYMFWPFVVIPYSDNWAILIGVLFLYLYSVNPNFKNILLNVLFGFLIAFAYLMKPSTIIFLIALIIIKIIAFKKTKNVHELIISMSKIVISLCIGFTVLYLPVKYYQHNNNLVTINSSKKMPMTHFMAMGLSNDGGFNSEDVLKNVKIKDPQARNKYNLKLIKERYQQKGFAGYLKFLVQKQINNTADGSYGWSAEGLYIYNPFTKRLNAVEQWQRNKFMQYDKNQKMTITDINMGGYKFIPQLLWVMVIILMLFASLKNLSLNIQLLKYTVVGGFTFLLLFEGGRSRYLIQFLPYVYTLAGVGLSQLYLKLKQSDFK